MEHLPGRLQVQFANRYPRWTVHYRKIRAAKNGQTAHIRLTKKYDRIKYAILIVSVKSI